MVMASEPQPSVPMRESLANHATYFCLYLFPDLPHLYNIASPARRQYYLSGIPTQDSIVRVVNAVVELGIYTTIGRLASIIAVSYYPCQLNSAG